MTKNIFLLVCVLMYSNIFGQSKSAEVFMKSLQQKFNQISDLKADFSQKIISSSRIRGTELSGKFYYKKSGKYRIEVNDKILFSDGIAIYNLDNKLLRVVISPLDESTSAFSIEKIIYEFPKTCILSYTDEGNSKIIEMMPKNSGLSFKKISLHVNSENLPQKIQVIDLAENQTTIELGRLIINSNVPESKFVFTAQKGLEIVDLR